MSPTTDGAMPAAPTTTSPSRVHLFGRLDPRRFHGAWIFLCESIAAGAIVGGRYGVEPAMLVGTACAGAFLVFAAIATGVSGKARQVSLGTLLVLVSPVCALLLRADARFIHIAGVATLAAIATVVLAKRHGFLSPIVMATGVASLALVAPMTAVAGGASMARAMLLFAILWALFCWRSLQVASLVASRPSWNAELLRKRGLREAALTATCMLLAAALCKAIPMSV